MGKELVNEYAIGYSDGGMMVRPRGRDIEQAYPLQQWIANNQRNGGKVFMRTVEIWSDWKEVLSDPAPGPRRCRTDQE